VFPRWWGWRILTGIRMYTIKEHLDETPSIKTIRLAGDFEAIAGQFVMVWVPGVDEFPMSLSYTGEGFGVTYQVLGDGTKALGNKRPGEKIGIRGPYGKGFAIHGKRLLAVGGGTGMAPLGLFVEDAVEHKASVTAIVGARTAKELLFESRCRKAGAEVLITTDDGSTGFKGLATELANEILAKKKFDMVYACGPEKMVVGLLSLVKGKSLGLQASLERHMKCGIGICDSCALDGKHVCRDGPVFADTELRSFEQLGKTKLDVTGRKTPL
jgi:dihydroorotate dehydrogenase electron transfer subunit